MDVFSYARKRNSRHIHNHTFQHKNIQPFTSEKRLGGMHSPKHFSKSMGAFWKESASPTLLLLNWAEIAQQMGSLSDSWKYKVLIVMILGFAIACSVNTPPAHISPWAHLPLGGAQQNGTGTKAMEIICVEFKILTLSAKPVRSTDEKHSVTGGYSCLYYIPHWFKNQGKVITFQDFSIRVCITISQRTFVYSNTQLLFWLC